MKIAITKIGSRFTESSESIAIGEVKSIARILKKSPKVDKVTIFTLKLPKDNQASLFQKNEFEVKDLVKNKDLLNEYDAMLVVNGSTNFFGGVEGTSAITETFSAIRSFNNKIFYCLCDPAITLKQLNIKTKSWSSKWEAEDYLHIDKKINYICQAYDLDAVKASITDSDVQVDKFFHFSFDKFPFLYDKNMPLNDNPIVDISYGGTFRSGRREADLIKYYFGHADDISVELFGKIKLDDFNPNKTNGLREPTFSGYVDYNKFNAKMNQALSTVIVGDPIYIKTEDIAQRVYESIISKVVTFIDSNYDKKRHIYSDEELRDFCYVSSVGEIDEKIRLLKSDPDFRRHIVEKQYNNTCVTDLVEYANELVDIVNEG